MKDIINIVVDIESLSLRPNAAILSIAALPFDISPVVSGNAERNPFLRYKDYPAFFEVANTMTCAFAGLDFDHSTIDWWRKQSDEAKNALLEQPSSPIMEVMLRFHEYLMKIKHHFDTDIRIWAQGSDFDIAVLRSAYDQFLPGVALPWNHKDVRCARTFTLEILECAYGAQEKLMERIPPMPDGEKWVRHSAMSDARCTAWNISYCYGLCRSSIARCSLNTIHR